jgi:hypothetical protein
MIEFKIITCPDKSQQATYQHLGTELTIGKSEGDMVVDDPAMAGLQLRVKLEGEKNATLENLHLGVEVRLNGKAVSGVVPLKEKDNLTVSRTTINFSRLDSQPLQPPEPYQHPGARERLTPGSKEQTILDALEFLESKTPEPASASPQPSKPPVPGGAQPPKPPLPAGSAGPPKPPLPPGMSAPPPLPGGGPPLPKKS